MPSKSVKKQKKDTQIFFILSGKGGTGKTFVTANLGTAIAEQGKKVLLVDANFTSPNLHTFFQTFTMTDQLMPNGEKSTLPIQQTDIANMMIVPGNRYIDKNDLTALYELDWTDIFEDLDFNYILVDMAPGWDPQIINVMSRSDTPVYVIEPTPLSIESFYSLFKRILASRISQEIKAKEAKHISEVILSPSRQDLKDMRDIIDFYNDENPKISEKLSTIIKNYRPSLIINNTRLLEDKDIGASITFLCKRQFNVNLSYIGAVDYEESIWQANKKRQLLISDKQLSVATRAFNNIAINLMDMKN
ncbi:MAG: P-loop NTPase [Acidobacteria bacterium]|nr:P-loop NTPase [Acidobacteriota bacterium]